jgi:hypothetical protein
MKKLFIGLSLVSQLMTTSAALALRGAHPGAVKDDSALISALTYGRNVNYIEAGNLLVIKLLPDDTRGSAHQKWVAQLSDGSTVLVVYNTDLSARVPIRVGDRFGVGGEYISDKNGPVLHWLHEDPSGRRPDGYIYLDGSVYGAVN